MKKTLLLLTTFFALAACDTEAQIDNRNENYTPIQLTRAQQELSIGVNTLAFNTLDRIVNENSEEDLLLSPLSLSAALSMVANGADGDTLSEIIATLGFEGKSIEDVNAYYRLLIDALVNADRKVDFISANSVWVAPDFTILNSFKKSVEENFMAKVDNVDFGSTAGIERINDWCSENTNGKIPTFFDKPDPSLKVFLANALYFNGSWKKAFKNVENKDFHHANGDVSPTKSIVATRDLNYYADEHLQLVEIPYGNGAYAMDIILPTEGISLDQTAAHLAQEGVWESIIHRSNYQEVNLQFPKFRIENTHNLNDILIELGMPTAFTPMADFSKMANSNLMISWVIQKTYIDVTEKGTTAAAVTGTGMIESAGPPSEPVSFIADHPFFFLIRERSTGIVLFMGAKC